MNYLCMDTSTGFLAIGIIADDRVAAGMQEVCWKKQSEEIFPSLNKLLSECGLSAQDIDGIVISRGPGSYTGVRIAMSIAKVWAAVKRIPLYTVSTLQLYAGRCRNCRVLVDARGGRAYTALYDNGDVIGTEEVLEIDEIHAENETVIGDGHLIGRDDVQPDICANFLALKDLWVRSENVHTLVPEYLKPAAAYLVKK